MDEIALIQPKQKPFHRMNDQSTKPPNPKSKKIHQMLNRPPHTERGLTAVVEHLCIYVCLPTKPNANLDPIKLKNVTNQKIKLRTFCYTYPTGE